MNTKTQIVHFSVEPGFYEQHARGLMLEQNWRGALSFLMDTLTGMTLDLAVDVLRGKLSIRRDADGDLATCEQDPTDKEFTRFVGTYDWQHAGLWQVEAEFYQPYAVVERFGRDDENYARERLQLDDERDYTPHEYRTLRAMYFADRRESDLVHFDLELGAVLFKRVPGPAFWHTSHKDPASAIREYRDRRRLDVAEVHESRDKLSTDFRHWKFYVPALRLGQLREPRWDEELLTRPVLQTLSSFVALQDRVRIARWQEEAARNGHVLDEEDETPEDVNPETARELESRFETAVLRAEIREKAAKHGGFITLVMKERDEAETPVEVPALPLLWWASRNIGGFRFEDLDHWATVCPSGLKMLGDSANHTDWWVGAGFEPGEAYYQEHPLNKAAWAFSLHLSFTHGCDFVKLAGKGRAFGRVVFPKPNETVPEGSIAVVPFAGVDYEMAMLSACKKGRGAVIAQVGGKMAHLAKVGRELESRLVVVDNAMTAFKEGEFVMLDLDKMTLQRHKTVYSKDDPAIDAD